MEIDIEQSEKNRLRGQLDDALQSVQINQMMGYRLIIRDLIKSLQVLHDDPKTWNAIEPYLKTLLDAGYGEV